MKFARWLFSLAAIYGFVVLAPLYFLEERVGRDQPPPVNHPELYYGFVGLALAWQVVFVIIARDPARYRLMMIPSFLEKALYAGAVYTLVAQGRVPAASAAYAVPDTLFSVLFLVAFRLTRPTA